MADFKLRTIFEGTDIILHRSGETVAVRLPNPHEKAIRRVPLDQWTTALIRLLLCKDEVKE